MSKKSTIPNLEYKLLLIASSFIPFAIVVGIIVSTYLTLFTPPPTNTKLTACHFPTFFENAFLISVLVCGFNTSILVISRHIFRSWLNLLLPVILFVLFAVERIYQFYNSFLETPSNREKGLLWVFQEHYLIAFGIIFFLFLWHTKVIIQDRIREKQLNPNLP